MIEEELKPYVGKRVTLKLHQDKLPEAQRGIEPTGVLSLQPLPGFPIPNKPTVIAVVSVDGDPSVKWFTIDLEVISEIRPLDT